MNSILLELFKELVFEFNSKKNILFANPKLGMSIKAGNVSKEGETRSAASHSILTSMYIEPNSLLQTLKHFLRDFNSVRKIYEYVVSNNLWHVNFESYEQNCNTFPSITSSIIGGFLYRNFVLNNNNFIITEASFDQTFSELLTFFSKDYIDREISIQIIGLNGDISSIQLTKNVLLQKADYETARQFSQYYSLLEYEIEMFEGDYVLKISDKEPKKNFNLRTGGNGYRKVNDLVNKWRNVPILGCPGYIKIGTYIVRSKDWPIIYNSDVGPYGIHGTGHFSKQTEVFCGTHVRKINIAAKVIDSANLSKIDENILYSIERLSKSKSANNINDRVVELSISLEYLINTDNKDITLQLCLKLIKLLFNNNVDETIYPKLKKFYGLRSHVVHGNKKIHDNQENLEIISFAESIIQSAIVRMIKLSATYSYKDINKALVTSMHVSKSVTNLLKQFKSTNLI